MSSPFPGMNPYIEQDDVWHDFHERFIPAMAEMLTAQVMPRYIVKIDEHVYIHELPESDRRYVGRPDVAVSRGTPAPSSGGTAATIPAPLQRTLPAVDVEGVSFLEIRDRQNRELIAVIELLSPSNKRPGSDRNQYLAKRNQVLASAAHLVEIDLLRGGQRMPVEDMPECDYCVMVSRVADRPRVDLWPISLHDALSPCPVPLRDGDADASLDLQAALHRVYDAAGYAAYIYQGEPQPPLGMSEGEWIQRLIPTS